eukprot:NODE_671_length_5354_cov_0.091722.p1 type:complete len:352 gc:universal NODE_671_length_5354_cov_0.091722:53-1108(+)
MLFLGYSLAAFCTSGNGVCYTMAQSDGLLQVKIDTTISGWVGLGVGSSMQGDVYVFWKVGNQVILSSRQSSNQLNTPSINANPNVKITNSVITTNGFSVTFTRAISTTGGYTTPVTNKFMAAYRSGAISSTDPSYRYAEHSFKSNFVYTVPVLYANNTSSTNTTDITNTGNNENTLIGGDSSSTTSSEIYSTLHGYFMIFSWLFCIPMADLISRFGKDSKLGAKWYPLHKILNISAFIATTIALVLICIDKNNVVFTDTNFFHPFIGSIMYGLVVLQIVLGVYINKKYDHARTSIPWYDKMHWGMGYMLLFLGYTNSVIASVIIGGGYIITGILFFVFFMLIFMILEFSSE